MTTSLFYVTGDEIRLGDRINADGMVGTVVCVISSAEFTPEFPEEHWAYLQQGFMFRSDEGVLIHYDCADECTSFIARP